MHLQWKNLLYFTIIVILIIHCTSESALINFPQNKRDNQK